MDDDRTQEEQDGMDEAFAAYQAQEDDEDYQAEQAALPPHQRDGYLENLLERVDMERKRKREEG